MRAAAARRVVLKPPGAVLIQSGPESTGYHEDRDLPPVLNIRPLDLSLLLESRGPICPGGPKESASFARSVHFLWLQNR